MKIILCILSVGILLGLSGCFSPRVEPKLLESVPFGSGEISSKFPIKKFDPPQCISASPQCTTSWFWYLDHDVDNLISKGSSKLSYVNDLNPSPRLTANSESKLYYGFGYFPGDIKPTSAGRRILISDSNGWSLLSFSTEFRRHPKQYPSKGKLKKAKRMMDKDTSDWITFLESFVLKKDKKKYRIDPVLLRQYISDIQSANDSFKQKFTRGSERIWLTWTYPIRLQEIQ